MIERKMASKSDFKERNFKSILGENAFEFIQSVKLLIIGAGGIGCELLKNVVFSGFLNITIIDLDTIDLSNLNRQFLYRREDHGKSKAMVAAQMVREMCNEVNLTAYEGDIRSSDYSVEFFEQFDIVLNALDNNETRKHVNRLCLAANRILIDAGSGGYNGQVTPILARDTLCFECEEKPSQKSFPICTIRHKPETPEHCIAWSKYLFELIFGACDDNNYLHDLLPNFQITRDCTNERAADIAQDIFKYLFETEIKDQIAILSASTSRKFDAVSLSFEDAMKLDCFDHDKSSNCGRSSNEIEWSLKECATKFVESVRFLLKNKSDQIGKLKFDKDDDSCLDFVTAASNLRMYNFKIGRKSRWEVQSIAGSIIPAIVSTNAVVAGVQTAQLINCVEFLFKKKYTRNSGELPSLINSNVKQAWICSRVIGKNPDRMGSIIIPETLEGPKKNCFVCQGKQITIKLHSFSNWTLRNFIKIILFKNFGMIQATIDTSTRVIWDPSQSDLCDDGCDEKFEWSLFDWEVKSGSILTITDYNQGAFQFSARIIEDPAISETHKDDLFVIMREETSMMDKILFNDEITMESWAPRKSEKCNKTSNEDLENEANDKILNRSKRLKVAES